MTESTSSSREAWITVTLTARGSLNLDDDASLASQAVAEWLDQNTPETFRADFAAYADMLETGDETEGSRRFEALRNAARAIGYPVATAGWLNLDADHLFDVAIEPR